MSQNTFRYTYCAKEQKEVQQIRQKYLPRSESKLDELKRLDHTVCSSGIAEALCAGIGGALFFGAGLWLTLQFSGISIFLETLGILLGLFGTVGILAAYPVYRKVFREAKEKYAPRILELSAELTGFNKT